MIINRYKSYQLYKFEKYYKKQNIIILCILLYLSYKFQLLNIEYFSLLKQLYKAEIEKLIYIYIIYISKENFFSAFYTVFYIIIIVSNTQAEFQTVEFVLYNSNYIILQLDIRLYISILLLILSIIWKSKTLNNILKLQS